MIARFLLGLGLLLPLVCSAAPAALEKAYFAGGCFWCTEADFEKLPGVKAAISGYMGGSKPDPTYEEVSTGSTGHTESVEVQYDPAQVSYAQLVAYFWQHIDPTVKDQQFCDIGSQYRSAIFFRTAAEKAVAITSRDQLLSSRRVPAVYTEITAAGPFYPAEDYHQNYYQKNPIRYAYYRHGCGRDARLKKIWGTAKP